MNPLSSLPILLVSACVPQGSEEPLGEPFDLQAEGAAVVGVAGPAPLAVPVRAVNAWGAAVASDPLTVGVDGVPTTVVFDAWGYGEVVVSKPGASLVTAGDADADVLVLDGPLLPLPRAHAVAANVVAVAAADQGALVATPDAVWFAGTDGRSWPVLRPVGGGTIAGVVSGHLDRDGILDAIAWNSEAVVVLRGRPAGGFTWLFGIRAQSHAPLAAAIGDTTGDTLPDFAIGWADLDGVLEVWEATGPETWAPAPPAALPVLPVGVAIGDNVADGVAQVTVTGDDGQWYRYTRSNGAYALTGPTSDQLALVTESGAVTVTDGDYNGDGGEELFVLDPRVPLVERRVQAWDLVGTRPSSMGLGAMGAWAEVEDSTGDGLADLWLLAESGEMSHLAWAGGLNARRTLSTLPDPGPLAARDQDGDGLAEAFVAGRSAWRWWGGREVVAEAGPWWGPAMPSVSRLEVGAEDPLVTADLDGSDTTVEVAAFAVTGGTTEVRAYRFAKTADAIPTLFGKVTLGASVTPVDLAACKGTIWALAGGKLWMIVSDTTSLAVIDAATTGGTAVACGAGPSGSVVAVLDTGFVTLRDAGLSVVDTRTVPDAVDIGLVSGDLATCEAEGCSVVGWNWNGTGPVPVWTDATGTTVGTDPLARLAGVGALAVGDVDGDGNEDLAAIDVGALVVNRSAGDGFGVAEAYHLGGSEPGAIFADVNGDGADDPVWIDAGGAIVWPAPTTP